MNLSGSSIGFIAKLQRENRGKGGDRDEPDPKIEQTCSYIFDFVASYEIEPKSSEI
jgi:hypothetical protein